MLLGRMPGRYSSTVQYSSHALHMNIGLTCAQALFAGDEYRSQYPKCHGGHVRFLEGDTRNQTSLFMKCSVWKNTVIPHFQGLAKYEERRRALRRRIHYFLTMPCHTVWHAPCNCFGTGLWVSLDMWRGAREEVGKYLYHAKVLPSLYHRASAAKALSSSVELRDFGPQYLWMSFLVPYPMGEALNTGILDQWD